MRQVLAQGFTDSKADEGTLWLVDSMGEYLVPAYNTGPNADKLIGKFRQPLNAGLICMVFASEQPFIENDVRQNSRQSPLLDNLLQVQTYALIAVPFYFLKTCRGVISCVQLKTSNTESQKPTGFAPGDLETVQRAASVLTRLIDYRLLGSTVDWVAE